jgi:hypothetical protein
MLGDGDLIQPLASADIGLIAAVVPKSSADPSGQLFLVMARKITTASMWFKGPR